MADFYISHPIPGTNGLSFPTSLSSASLLLDSGESGGGTGLRYLESPGDVEKLLADGTGVGAGTVRRDGDMLTLCPLPLLAGPVMLWDVLDSLTRKVKRFGALKKKT